jgi:hypothetical protein
MAILSEHGNAPPGFKKQIFLRSTMWLAVTFVKTARLSVIKHAAL